MTPAAAKGVHHIGLTVPDMQEAVRIPKAVLGCVKVIGIGGLDVDDDFMANQRGGRLIGDHRAILCVSHDGAGPLSEVVSSTLFTILPVSRQDPQPCWLTQTGLAGVRSQPAIPGPNPGGPPRRPAGLDRPTRRSK